MPVNEWNEPNYWLSCITLDGNIKPLDIILALEQENTESRPIWKPMHMQPFYAKYDFIGKGISKQIFVNGICLPSDTKMSDGDLKRIIKVIRGLWVSGVPLSLQQASQRIPQSNHEKRFET